MVLVPFIVNSHVVSNPGQELAELVSGCFGS